MKTRPPYYRLHPDFIAAARVAARRTDSTPLPGFEYIGGNSFAVVVRKNSRDARLLERFAQTIRYAGPLFGDEAGL
jgi:hypothetical protein